MSDANVCVKMEPKWEDEREPGNIKVIDTNEEPGLEIYHEIKVEVVFDNAGVLSDTECLQGK